PYTRSGSSLAYVVKERPAGVSFSPASLLGGNLGHPGRREFHRGSSGGAPDTSKPGQSRSGAEIGQRPKRGWFVEMCERCIKLRSESQWVKQLADAANRLGLTTCFLRPVDSLQGP